LRLSRRLGQHLLIDQELRDRVVAAAGIRSDDEVLEIGAGPGTLTAELARLARRVVAVEMDRRMLPRLRAAAPSAEIVAADILKVDPRVMFPRGGEVVVGNVPYYLSGALVPHLLQVAPRPRRLSLVVQREVARRWCGIDGWSLSTVAVQTFSVPRLEFELPPEAFDPPPQVTSALVVMDVRAAPAIQVEDFDGFFRFAESVFQFRRKQIRGSLARAWDISAPEAAARLEAQGLDPERRAETLTLAEWESIFRSA
jgi:16S rRNA (adenine1518-N6/adenine1519-N6)-dimethyltransferase